MISFFTLAQKKKKKRWKKKKKKKKRQQSSPALDGEVKKSEQCRFLCQWAGERGRETLFSVTFHQETSEYHWSTRLPDISLSSHKYYANTYEQVSTPSPQWRLRYHSSSCTFTVSSFSNVCMCVCVCVRRGICGQRAGICSRLGQTGFSPTAAKLQLPALRWKQPPLPHPNTTNNC